MSTARDRRESETADTNASRARNHRAHALPAHVEFAAAVRGPEDASTGTLQALLEAPEPGFDPIGGFPQLVDAVQELFQLRLVHEIAAFFLQIFGDIFAGRAAGAACQLDRALGELRQAP